VEVEGREGMLCEDSIWGDCEGKKSRGELGGEGVEEGGGIIKGGGRGGGGMVGCDGKELRWYFMLGKRFVRVEI
jgi:hypothetical protein